MKRTFCDFCEQEMNDLRGYVFIKMYNPESRSEVNLDACHDCVGNMVSKEKISALLLHRIDKAHPKDCEKEVTL